MEIFDIKELPSSKERDYSNCNNFICPLELVNILENINRIVSNGNTLKNVNQNEITFDIGDNCDCTISIYTSNPTNKHLIAVKTSRYIETFGHFYSNFKREILKRK